LAILGGLVVYFLYKGLLNRKNKPGETGDKHSPKNAFLEHLLRMNKLKVKCAPDI
jgi:hypothetical protein